MGQISRVIGIGDVLAASIKMQVGAPTKAPLAPIGDGTEEEPGTQKKGKDRGQSSLLDF
jgi:hypothetical protein